VLISNPGEGDLVECLKKTPTGKYNAADVDRLLLKIRCDYENCLREQKQRILELRSENRDLLAVVDKYRTDAQYVSDTIAQAQHTAKKIVQQAEIKAMRLLAEAEARSHHLEMETQACATRLEKLKKASESVYKAACRALPEEDQNDSARVVAQAVLSLYDSEPWQEPDIEQH
jgi:cell division septum initiation protein DivIVA